MPSRRNIDTVERIKDDLNTSTVVISTGFTGLDVATLTGLRRRLRERGLEYRVVKNTLASIAADQTGRPQIKEVIEGQTGLVLGTGDPVEVAKALTEYLRSSRIPLQVRGAVVGRQVYSPEEVGDLAAVPPMPELMARLVGQLAGVMTGLARALNSPAQGLATALNGPQRGLATVLQRSAERG